MGKNNFFNGIISGSKEILNSLKYKNKLNTRSLDFNKPLERNMNISIKDGQKIILGKKNKNKEIFIFLDIDGVIGNWLQNVCNTFDIDLNDEDLRNKLKNGEKIENYIEGGEDKMWEEIDKKGSEWWEDMELFPWSRTLRNKLKKEGKVCLLTSPPRNPEATVGKINWIKKHFKDTNNFLIGKNKYFCASPKSILIDDSEKKINKFEEAGGNIFLWPNSLEILDGKVKIEELYKEVMEKIGKIQ